MFLVLAGIVSGIVSGLGMGGGTILIIILTNMLDFSQHIAQASNILFFIPTSIAAIWIHVKNKNVDKRLMFKMAIPGIVGGMAGSYVSGITKAENLKKYFGIFLLIIGTYEIIITVKNNIKEK